MSYGVISNQLRCMQGALQQPVSGRRWQLPSQGNWGMEWSQKFVSIWRFQHSKSWLGMDQHGYGRLNWYIYIYTVRMFPILLVFFPLHSPLINLYSPLLITINSDSCLISLWTKVSDHTPTCLPGALFASDIVDVATGDWHIQSETRVHSNDRYVSISIDQFSPLARQWKRIQEQQITHWR